MDSIVHGALEEICSHGANGLYLSNLWPKLHSSFSSIGSSAAVDPAVKQALWSNLLTVPGLRFQAQGTEFDPTDPKIKSFEDCERLDLKILPSEHLADSFLGLCDVKTSNSVQRRVLERLAMARTNGVTQNQLSKELGMPGNNFFYVVKKLECQGLVVRQSTVVRTKEASGCSPVTTNLVHLYRYATPLGSQQRLEITKESRDFEENPSDSIDDGNADFNQETVLIKDFLPALKAVCDKLEQADEKVLVVSDIKADLGYRGTPGHRAWRNICNRLQQAGLVEVFEAKMDDKAATKRTTKRRKTPLTCLRLLKTFSPKLFESKALEGGNGDTDLEQLPSVRRGQNTEQLVELPIDQQIYRMIDAEGSKGLVAFELYRRLGINNKKNHNRIDKMASRFGLHQLTENHNKTTVYRCWTQKNLNTGLSGPVPKGLEDVSHENATITPSKDPNDVEGFIETATDKDCATPSCDPLALSIVENRDRDFEQEASCQESKRSYKMLLCPTNEHNISSDTSITVPTSELSLVNVDDSGVAFEEKSIQTPSKLPKAQARQLYPSMTSARREQRILERLKVEKFVLRSELLRWLENLEKERQTKMDRKTLTRCLMNLQKEGHCRVATVSVPSFTNYGRNRIRDVVLHSSVQDSISELSDQLHDKIRSFEMQIRGQGSSRAKNEDSLPVLTSIQRIQPNSNSSSLGLKSETMHENGIMLPKMVRTRLLHCFLWDYVSNSSYSNQGLSTREQILVSKNPLSTCRLFRLEQAVQAIPPEMFLQLVGHTKSYKEIMEKGQNDDPLSDPPEEYKKCLTDTQATGRISRLIDILHRLKLIRLVAEGSAIDGTKVQTTTLTHALELKPYIEEPKFIGPVSLGSDWVDLRPHFRHDFVLLTKEAVEKYWESLEYCYAAAGVEAALHAFPGSSVPELIRSRSWTIVKVMAPEHRSELVKRVLKSDQPAKITLNECKEIASDLNLSIAQVLRVYYDKRQQRVNRFQGVLDPYSEEFDLRRSIHSPRKKRKTGSEAGCSNLNVNHASDAVREHEMSENPEQHNTVINESGHPSLNWSKARFVWTEEADKQLILQYVRHRSSQGAKGLTSWHLITDLPAPTSCCKKRIYILKRNMNFRKSLMKLCNLLSQRYAQQLDKVQERKLSTDKESEDLDRWDNFDNDEIKKAFDEVISNKPLSRPQVTRGSSSALPTDFEESNVRMQKGSSQKTSCRHLPQKFIKHWEEGLSNVRQVYRSVAVANAVELFKLVFLNASTSPEVPNLLAETLRCYSEHDLFSAFHFLREKKIMVRSGGSNPYVLSQHFLQSLSLSQFPTNTGKRASKFDDWIQEREKDLIDGAVNLFPDLQCGDIFHLFALVFSEEFSISPLLPDEGIGEAEDKRNLKRKYGDDNQGDSSRKQKYHSLQESELFSRREKGFPGISVSLRRTTIPKSGILEFFKADGVASLLCTEDDRFYSALTQQIHNDCSNIRTVEETPDFGSIIPEAAVSSESQWEVMTNFAKQVLKQPDRGQSWMCSNVLKSIFRAVQKAGDQGISISEVSDLICMPGEDIAEYVVDVLEAFGLVLKVNGYTSVHVVDALYRSKYFLNPRDTRCKHPRVVGASASAPRNDEDGNTGNVEGHSSISSKRVGTNVDEVHKVTILNLSEETTQKSNEVEAHGELGQNYHSKEISAEKGMENEYSDTVSSNFPPIFPWINGDGTINRIVYKGVTRRILAIVMQNPGILEDEVVRQMDMLNPQSCKKLLQLMILDKHIIVRKMHQTTSFGPPPFLKSLVGCAFETRKFVFREHLFANPTSTTML